MDQFTLVRAGANAAQSCRLGAASTPLFNSLALCLPLSAGIDAFGYEDRRRVQQSFLDLRLDRPAARAVLSDVARKYFLQYVTQSRNTRNRLDAAKVWAGTEAGGAAAAATLLCVLLLLLLAPVCSRS